MNKKCPRCAQLVPVEASICAHCRSKLPYVGPDWWEASDGVVYPPQAHPDFAARSKERQPRRPMSRRAKVALGVGIAALVLAPVAWFTDLGGVRCNYYRDQLLEAKGERFDDMGDQAGIDAVADAARTARDNGCDVDDLIDPSVGR